TRHHTAEIRHRQGRPDPPLRLRNHRNRRRRRRGCAHRPRDRQRPHQQRHQHPPPPTPGHIHQRPPRPPHHLHQRIPQRPNLHPRPPTSHEPTARGRLTPTRKTPVIVPLLKPPPTRRLCPILLRALVPLSHGSPAGRVKRRRCRGLRSGRDGPSGAGDWWVCP